MDTSTLFAVLVIFFGFIAFGESVRRWRTVAKARNRDSLAWNEIQPYGWSLYQSQFFYGLRGMVVSTLLIVIAIAYWSFLHLR